MATSLKPDLRVEYVIELPQYKGNPHTVYFVKPKDASDNVAMWVTDKDGNYFSPETTGIAKFISLQGDNVFLYSRGINGGPDKQTITIQAVEYGFQDSTSLRIWEYYSNGLWVNIPINTSSISINAGSPMFNGGDKIILRYRRENYSDQIQVYKVYSGSDTQQLVITSSMGNVLDNLNISTILTAHIYIGADEYTDIDPVYYTWTRYSGNTILDTQWNNTYGKSGKSIEITRDMVGYRAIFDCLVDNT